MKAHSWTTVAQSIQGIHWKTITIDENSLREFSINVLGALKALDTLCESVESCLKVQSPLQRSNHNSECLRGRAMTVPLMLSFVRSNSNITVSRLMSAWCRTLRHSFSGANIPIIVHLGVTIDEERRLAFRHSIAPTVAWLCLRMVKGDVNQVARECRAL